MEAVLAELQTALEAAGTAGLELAGKFQQCLELIPNFIDFGNCVQGVVDSAAGPAQELASALEKAATALAALGAEALDCAKPVLEEANTAIEQVAQDAVHCFEL